MLRARREQIGISFEDLYAKELSIAVKFPHNNAAMPMFKSYLAAPNRQRFLHLPNRVSRAPRQ